MIWILLVVYLFVTFRTIWVYRWVNKKHPELSIWDDPHHINLLWMLVPVVQLIFLIEAVEIKLKLIK